MPSKIACPACAALLTAADSLLGRKVRCPKCAEPFTVQRSTGTEPAHPLQEDQEPPGQTYDVGTTSRAVPVAAQALVEEAERARRAKRRPPPSTAPSHLGNVALALCGVAFLFAWIPGVAVASIPLSAIALLLGVAGLIVYAVQRSNHLALPLAGVAVSVPVLALSLAVVFWPSKPSAPAGREDAESAPQAKALPEMPPPNAVWIDDERSVVQIGSVRLESIAPALRDGRLLLALRVSNLDFRQRMPFRSWGAASGPAADGISLSDDTGHRYARMALDRGQVPAENQVIAPGEHSMDLFAFEPPRACAEYLKLHLPGSHVGLKDPVIIRIAVRQIHVPGGVFGTTVPPAPVLSPGGGAAPAPPFSVLARHREALTSPDRAARRSAAEALGGLGAEAVPAIPDLLGLLRRDTDEAVRAAAATALGKLGARARIALPALRRAASEPSDLVSQAAEEAMTKLGRAIAADVPDLAIYLTAEDPFLRVDAVAALAFVGADGAARRSILTALEDRAAAVRVQAARAIWEAEPASGAGAIQRLLAVLRDTDPEARREAARALRDAGRTRVRAGGETMSAARYLAAVLPVPHRQTLAASLQEGTRDEDPLIRVYAADALWRLAADRKHGISILTVSLRHSNPSVRLAAAEALLLGVTGTSREPTPAREAAIVLLGFCRDADSQTRRAAVAALGAIVSRAEDPKYLAGYLSSRDAVRTLATALRDADTGVRRLAVDQLRRLGPEAREAIVALRVAGRDVDPRIARAARAAAEILAPSGKELAPVLVAALTDYDPAIRAEAAGALAAVGADGIEAIPDLVRLVRDSDARVRTAAAETLATWRVDTERPISELIRALKSADGDVRDRAALVLAGKGPEARDAATELAALASRDARAAPHAVLALFRIGPAAAPALARLLEEESWKLRLEAARALGELGPAAKAAAPKLGYLSEVDPSRTVRDEAKKALGRIEPAKAP